MSRSSLTHSWVHRRVPGRHGRAWSLGRAGMRALAMVTAVAIPLGMTHGVAAAAVTAPGNGFVVTPADLAFVLRQIKIAEEHAATLTPTNPCGTLVNQPGDGIPDNLQIPDRLTAYGLRTVDGSCNNLFPGREKFAAADVPFPRLATPSFRPAEASPPAFGPPQPSSYAQKKGNVFDSEPRTVSNLIVDQTSTNPAAIAAAEFPVRTQGNPGLFPCTTDPDPLATPPVEGVPAGCVPSHQTLFIPNVTTDVGLSPPYNSLFTFFGQFFDHGVDQTVKSNGTVFVPLKADDPLITLGPDGRPNTGDEVTDPNQQFMVLTRAQNQPGPDGVVGDRSPTTNPAVACTSLNVPAGCDESLDDIQDANNTDTPWVDQSQTYSSHASHQVFLREYVNNTQNKPVSTGRLLGGLPAGQTYVNSPDGQNGIGTWAAVKKQAHDLLGLRLVDTDSTNIPMLATDPYGKFIPGANGLPQYVTTANTLVGGQLDDPATPADETVPVPANVRYFDTPFLTDIAHNADPSVGDLDHNPATPPTAPVPDADTTPSANFAAQPPGTYDDEMLNAHFSCGDGRCNENIALSTIHQVFHSEHDRLVADIKNTLTNDTSAGGTAALPDWQIPAVAGGGAAGWNGERLFQAARFITEMEYQHLVFEEFARKVQPAVRPFHVYQPDIQPAVKAEFAHAVYRFGHSMLDDTVARRNQDGSDNSTTLLNAFLNPPEYFNGGPAGTLTPEAAAGSIVMGSSDQVGNELDEFVTETLRNNLLGLPLDLPTINMARARSEGVPRLNDLRRQIFGQTNDGQLTPYTDWSDFGQHLKHPQSLINFVAAYGHHPTITSKVTMADKRAAAKLIVDPAAGEIQPADASDFMFSTGAWANAANGVTTTGVDDVDLWVGGLAELTNLGGGLLGSTFNYVFQNQLENLQDGDRLYYLARTPGTNLRTQLEGNSFAEMIQRNTDGTNTLKADAFATADCKFQLATITAPATPYPSPSPHPAPYPAQVLGAGSVNDDPATGCDENLLLLKKPDGTIQYRQFNAVDPSGINGQSVYNGGPGNDRIFGGNDNDTFWGGDGKDVIEGNNGDDIALGGPGDDIITDLGGADVPKGGAGNDAIDGGPGDDIVMGNDGSDFLNGGANDNETFAGEGNDFIIAGLGADAVFGDGGDDWIQGGSGQDLLQGDHGAPFFDDPAQTKPGNDIMIGQVGENDYDAEGGDDLMAQNSFVDRNAGSGGWDWAFHQYDTVAADDDMEINNNLVGVPIQVVVNRDRWQETENDSGSAFNDVIKGTDTAPIALGGAGFAGCDALDQAGIDRIAGLNALVPPALLTVDARTLDAASAAGTCPLTGNVFGAGNILLGGGGNDTITGRGADDIIDGDKSLRTRISVRTNAADPATQIGSADLMESQYLRDATGALTGPTLQADVFAGKVAPGQLVAVREIVSPASVPAADCGAAAPLNCDTAVFLAPRASYTITSVGGRTTVNQTGALNTAATPPQKVSDGIDTVTGMEQLQFSDGIVRLTAPAAPTGVTATAGNASATVSWTAPAANGSTIATYDIQVTTGTTTTLTTGVPATPTTRTITPLTNGASYTFQVRAVSDIGVAGPFSAPSTAVTPTAPAPTASALVPAAGSSGFPVANNVTVQFSAAVVGQSTANIVLRTVVGNTVVPGALTYNATTHVATVNPTTNLAANTQYRVTVTGGTATTGLRSATTPAVPVVSTSWTFTTITPPSAPTIGIPAPGPAGGALEVIARWTAPTSTGGSPITNYRVTATSSTGAQTVSALIAPTLRNVTMVVPAGTYTMTVVAINAAGTSAPSAASTPAVVAR